MNYFMMGLAGTGKDTAAMILRNMGYYGVALADPIREEYKRFLKREDFKQNREMMIRIGEGYKKIYGQDIWCRIGMEKVRTLHQLGNGVVITDGRYPFEYDFFVNTHKFIPVRIEADDEVRLSRLQQRDGTFQMESLTFERKNFISSDLPAHVIENNGAIHELEDLLIKLVQNTRN